MSVETIIEQYFAGTLERTCNSLPACYAAQDKVDRLHERLNRLPVRTDRLTNTLSLLTEISAKLGQHIDAIS